MRAQVIAVALVTAGAAGYVFYQQSDPTAPAFVETAAAQTVNSERAPDGAALAFFSDICVEGRASFAQTETRALAAGWSEAPDDVDPSMARIMAISRGADLPQASSVVMHVYAHFERPQFLVLTGMSISGMPVNGCYVYDFAASGLPELSPFEVSLGEPTERISDPGVAEMKKWVRPAGLASVATLRLGYLPPGSPAAGEAGFNGLVLALTSISR